MSDEPDTEIKSETAGTLSMFLQEVIQIESRKFDQYESQRHFDRRNAVGVVHKKVNKLMTKALQNGGTADLQSLSVPSDMKGPARRAINKRCLEAEDIDYSRRNIPEDAADKLVYQLKHLAEELET